MFSLFSWLGFILDSEKVKLQDKKPKNDYIENLEKAYKSATGALAFAVILILVSTIIIVVSWYRANTPQPMHFLVKDSSEVVNSSVSPRTSTARAQVWAYEAVSDIYTFNFTNAYEVLESNKWLLRSDTFSNLSRNFTSGEDGLINVVIEKSLDVTIIPTSSVRMVRAGEFEGRRIWEMQMHAIIYFSGATKEENPSQRVLLSIIVEEVPASESPYGLLISKITTRKM